MRELYLNTVKYYIINKLVQLNFEKTYLCLKKYVRLTILLTYLSNI